MSDTIRVQWTIVPQVAPQPWLNCNRCGGPKAFRSSGKIRVNANGKRLDAWLIYKCTACDSTWNRPILERRPVLTVQAALREDQATLVRRLEFDAEALRRHARRIEQFDDVVVTRSTLSEATVSARRLEILCLVVEPTALRLDRLLASELQVSRRRLRDLVVLEEPSRVLHKPVRHGQRVSIELGEHTPVLHSLSPWQSRRD